MKQKKTIIKVAFNFVIVIVFSVLILALKSSNWFLECWGGIEFQTVVNQLLSPLKGTAKEILNEYCDKCVYPSIWITCILGVVYYFSDFCCKKMRPVFRVSVRCLLLGGGFLYIFIPIRRNVVAMGVPEYIENIKTASSIFETEYVAPDNVKIQFP